LFARKETEFSERDWGRNNWEETRRQSNMKKKLVALLVLVMSITTSMACHWSNGVLVCDDVVTTDLCNGATCYENIIVQTDTQTANNNVIGFTVPAGTPAFTQAGFVFAGSSGANNYFNQNLVQHADTNTVSGIMNQVGGIASVITSNQNVNYQNLIQNANTNSVGPTASMTQLSIETARIQKDKTYLDQYATQTANTNQVYDGKFVQSDIKAALVVTDPNNVKNIGLLFDPTLIRPGQGVVLMDP
jgi:hypothetical protein